MLTTTSVITPKQNHGYSNSRVNGVDAAELVEVSIGKVVCQCAKVWYAPTKRRRYFSKSAAVNAEALAQIMNRHPIEQAAYTYEVALIDPGFDWTREEPERYEKMLRRLKRIISKHVE